MPAAPGPLLHRFAVAAVLAAIAPAAEAGRRPTRPTAPAEGRPAPNGAGEGAFCSGEYAESLAAMSARARALDASQPPYTFCVRTTAVYECPFYGPDGSLRRTRTKVTAHGTAFAYRQQGGETLLLTNHHVAEWPAVTDPEHPVEDVPPGCRRVSDSLKIVDNESDGYDRDDIPLSRIVTDPQLDAAVLRAHASLPVMPWKIGRSAALRERNAVEVRGFPLGTLRARNDGKVVSAYDHDDERDWDHDDFVVDALLSQGNSGSPVLAVSCRTGELELVGIYHAAYARGSALNVVVGVDQLRDLMTTLKRAPRPRADAPSPLDAGARAALAGAAAADPAPYFPFGGLVGGVHARADGALVFELLPREFPLRTAPLVALEDAPADGGAFGALGRVWVGNGRALSAVTRTDLDADALSLLTRLLDALRRDALGAERYRASARAGHRTRESYAGTARLERAVTRTAAGRADLAQSAADLADRLCRDRCDGGGTLADALAAPPPAPPAEHGDPKIAGSR